MFKKTLMIGLALLLVLGLGWQYVPVQAQGVRSLPPAVPAILRSATLLRGFPPRIQITGALPPGCYQLHVSAPVIGKPNRTTSVRPIHIRVRGIQSKTCTSRLQRFTTTVTIDPFKLNLPAGRYLVRFNPVKGQTRFRVFFTIPRGLD